MSFLTSRFLPRLPILTPIRTLATGTKDWEGRQPSEHITNRKDELNVQASASHAGKRAKAEGASNSSASSDKDQGNNNERAKKDHPEAPGPVIGMNDERGGVSFLCY